MKKGKAEHAVKRGHSKREGYSPGQTDIYLPVVSGNGHQTGVKVVGFQCGDASSWRDPGNAKVTTQRESWISILSRCSPVAVRLQKVEARQGA